MPRSWFSNGKLSSASPNFVTENSNIRNTQRTRYNKSFTCAEGVSCVGWQERWKYSSTWVLMNTTEKAYNKQNMKWNEREGSVNRKVYIPMYRGTGCSNLFWTNQTVSKSGTVIVRPTRRGCQVPLLLTIFNELAGIFKVYGCRLCSFAHCRR
jgi:hypothetical protein